MRNRVRVFLKRFAALAVLMLLLTVNAAGAETVQGDLNARFANDPRIEYEGEEYHLRKRLTTVLLAGTDMGADSQGYSLGARNGGQADFLLVLAIDDANQTITPIQINRDTMTEITVLNVLGKVSGSRVAQICLAHSFSDGGVESCELLASAVSNYLKGTPIDHYFVMSLNGIGALNDALGGVEVTLEDDFSVFDPEMTAGTTLVLNGSQAQIFLRQRYYVGDQTNVARQSRQRIYLHAAAAKIAEKLNENVNYIDTLLDAVGENAVTDMSRGRVLNTANAARRYEIADVTTVEGETRLGDNGFMEFIPDERALTEMLIDVFYEKAE